MTFGKNCRCKSVRCVLLATLLFLFGNEAKARAPLRATVLGDGGKSVLAKKSRSQDDSFTSVPAKDLALRPENARKADALVNFVEGCRLEENAEMDNALE